MLLLIETVIRITHVEIIGIVNNRSNNSRQYNNNSRQDINRAQLNEAPVRINHNSVNYRSNHVYMRNNDLIIGSQSGLRNTQNITANNRQNGGSGKNGIYL